MERQVEVWPHGSPGVPPTHPALGGACPDLPAAPGRRPGAAAPTACPSPEDPPARSSRPCEHTSVSGPQAQQEARDPCCCPPPPRAPPPTQTLGPGVPPKPSLVPRRTLSVRTREDFLAQAAAGVKGTLNGDPLRTWAMATGLHAGHRAAEPGLCRLETSATSSGLAISHGCGKWAQLAQRWLCVASASGQAPPWRLPGAGELGGGAGTLDPPDPCSALLGWISGLSVTPLPPAPPNAAGQALHLPRPPVPGRPKGTAGAVGWGHSLFHVLLSAGFAFDLDKGLGKRGHRCRLSVVLRGSQIRGKLGRGHSRASQTTPADSLPRRLPLLGSLGDSGPPPAGGLRKGVGSEPILPCGASGARGTSEEGDSVAVTSAQQLWDSRAGPPVSHVCGAEWPGPRAGEEPGSSAVLALSSTACGGALGSQDR